MRSTCHESTTPNYNSGTHIHTYMDHSHANSSWNPATKNRSYLPHNLSKYKNHNKSNKKTKTVKPKLITQWTGNRKIKIKK